MNIYECIIFEDCITALGSYTDWVCAESEDEALAVYKDNSGNETVPFIRKLSEHELQSIYRIDFNELDPGELDEDDEDYDPNYDPDQWMAGGKITETFFEYLQRQTKSHFLDNYQNEW